MPPKWGTEPERDPICSWRLVRAPTRSKCVGSALSLGEYRGGYGNPQGGLGMAHSLMRGATAVVLPVLLVSLIGAPNVSSKPSVVVAARDTVITLPDGSQRSLQTP